MPIYEYLCTACNHECDALQKLSDAPLTHCPCCSESALKKKISAPRFRLTGSGWYETDFKTGDKKKNLGGDSKVSESEGSTSSDKSSDKSSDNSSDKSSDNSSDKSSDKSSDMQKTLSNKTDSAA